MPKTLEYARCSTHTLQGKLHTCTQGPHPGKAFSVGKLDWAGPPTQALAVLCSDPVVPGNARVACWSVTGRRARHHGVKCRRCRIERATFTIAAPRANYSSRITSDKQISLAFLCGVARIKARIIRYHIGTAPLAPIRG